jgi:hypothetical protein
MHAEERGNGDVAQETAQTLNFFWKMLGRITLSRETKCKEAGKKERGACDVETGGGLVCDIAARRAEQRCLRETYDPQSGVSSGDGFNTSSEKSSPSGHELRKNWPLHGSGGSLFLISASQLDAVAQSLQKK